MSAVGIALKLLPEMWTTEEVPFVPEAGWRKPEITGTTGITGGVAVHFPALPAL